MLKMAQKIVSYLAIAMFFFITTGCSQAGSSSYFGEKIPQNATESDLSNIIANPSNFNDKSVVLEGVISGQCASLCWFSFRSGTDVVEMFPIGFTPPKLDNGTRVRVYTTVSVGTERIVLSVLGMELIGGE